jgi:hypothetical protein
MPHVLMIPTLSGNILHICSEKLQVPMFAFACNLTVQYHYINKLCDQI